MDEYLNRSKANTHTSGSNHFEFRTEPSLDKANSLHAGADSFNVMNPTKSSKLEVQEVDRVHTVLSRQYVKKNSRSELTPEPEYLSQNTLTQRT